MAKKNRSSSSKSTPTFAGIQRGPSEFNPAYTNTKRDLKHIAVLAAIIFTSLIVLSFFLR